MPFSPSPEFSEALQGIPAGRKCKLSPESWNRLNPPPGLDYDKHAPFFARLIDYCAINLDRLAKPAVKPSQTRHKLRSASELANVFAELLVDISSDASAINALSASRDKRKVDASLKQLISDVAAAADHLKKGSVELPAGKRKQALKTEFISMVTQFLHKILFEQTGVGLSRTQKRGLKQKNFDFALNVLRQADRHITASMIQTAIKNCLEGRYDDANEWLLFVHETMFSVYGDNLRIKRTQRGSATEVQYFFDE